MVRLATWLEELYPIVEKEINETNNSKAFKGYMLHEDIEGAKCKLTQTIDVQKNHQGEVSFHGEYHLKILSLMYSRYLR